MNRRVESIRRQLIRYEWIAWVVLLVVLWMGYGQDNERATAHRLGPGVGYVAGDYAVTALMTLAAFLQTMTHLVYGNNYSKVESVSRWLMAGVSSVFAFRMGWLMLTVGDIYVPPITIGAFFAYAIAQILHCIAISADHEGITLP